MQEYLLSLPALGTNSHATLQSLLAFTLLGSLKHQGFPIPTKSNLGNQENRGKVATGYNVKQTSLGADFESGLQKQGWSGPPHKKNTLNFHF